MTKNPKTISVIGAGIMGIMNTYTLLKKFPDAEITLYDSEDFPANNASFIAGGMVSPFSELDHMPQSYLGAGLSSIDTWEAISKDLGNNFEFSKNGSLLISHQNDRYILERFKSILPHSDKWEQVGMNEIRNLEPSLPLHDFRYGVLIKGEAHLHPKKTMDALLSSATNKIVQYVDIKKEKLTADWVIDCRGIGAKSDESDLRGVKGETIVVRNPEFSLTRHIRLMHPRYPLYIVPREDNIFLIGATIIESEYSSNPTIRSSMELMSALYSVHRSFGDAEILDINAGIRPAYPDNLPRVSVNSNVISCNGLYRHGFLFAPIMAECVANIINETDYEFNHLFVRSNNHDDNLERKIA